MAIYVPPSRQKARRILSAAAFLVAGALIGFLAARVTAPSLADQGQGAQEQAREVAAGLRVLARHAEAPAISGQASTDFALQRTETGLKGAFAVAPWIPAATRTKLSAGVAELRRTRQE